MKVQDWMTHLQAKDATEIASKPVGASGEHRATHPRWLFNVRPPASRTGAQEIRRGKPPCVLSRYNNAYKFIQRYILNSAKIINVSLQEFFNIHSAV